MAKLLEKHSKRVAEHMVAAFLWDTLRGGVPILMTWITTHLAALRGWALPYVILVGAAVFALVSIGMRRFGSPAREPHQELSTTEQEIDFSPSAIEELLSEKQSLEEALTRRSAEVASLAKQLEAVQDRLVSHEQLIRTAVDDKATIKDLVMVCSIEPLKVTDKGAVHLEFRWVFLSMALYDVSIPSIAGFITFHKNGANKGIPFRIAPTLEEKVAAQNRAFRTEGCFIIQQDFQSSLEADDVLDSSPDSYYDFSNLIVNLTGDGFETRLNTNYRVKKNEQWLPRGNCDFIYACLAERDAKIAKLEAALSLASEANAF